MSSGDRSEPRFVDPDCSAPVESGVAGGSLAWFSRASPLKSSGNEDAAGYVELDAGRLVLALADGVGGQPSARKASRVAVEKLLECAVDAGGEEGELRAAILAGFDRANDAVCAIGGGAATTLVAVEVDPPSVRTFHVGDSEVLVLGGRGRIKFQTIPHSPTGYAIEAGLIDREDAMVHEDRHLISNVIGDPAMRVDVSSPLELAARDTVVVASDGLFDNLHTQEIVDGIRSGALADGVSRLVAACEARMAGEGAELPSKPDDLTILALRLDAR